MHVYTLYICIIMYLSGCVLFVYRIHVRFKPVVLRTSPKMAIGVNRIYSIEDASSQTIDPLYDSQYTRALKTLVIVRRLNRIKRSRMLLTPHYTAGKTSPYHFTEPVRYMNNEEGDSDPRERMQC